MLAALAFAASATAGPISDAGQALDDSVLNARIQTTYALNDSLDAVKISSEVNEGVVTLTGAVNSAIDKDLAGELARAFDDVERVDNQLMVKDEHRDAVEDEWRQRIDDATLNANVRRRLAYHSGLRAAMLDLDVEGGTVYVSGKVASAAERDLAMRIVRNTEDVRNVEASLTVDESLKHAPEAQKDYIGDRMKTGHDAKTVPAGEDAARDRVDDDDVTEDAGENFGDEVNDWWVERRVETSILLDRNVSLWDLDVEVENNTVILTGETISDAQRDLASTIARNTDGVRNVENHIRVVPAD